MGTCTIHPIITIQYRLQLFPLQVGENISCSTHFGQVSVNILCEKATFSRCLFDVLNFHLKLFQFILLELYNILLPYQCSLVLYVPKNYASVYRNKDALLKIIKGRNSERFC